MSRQGCWWVAPVARSLGRLPLTQSRWRGPVRQGPVSDLYSRHRGGGGAGSRGGAPLRVSACRCVSHSEDSPFSLCRLEAGQAGWRLGGLLHGGDDAHTLAAAGRCWPLLAAPRAPPGGARLHRGPPRATPPSPPPPCTAPAGP